MFKRLGAIFGVLVCIVAGSQAPASASTIETPTFAATTLYHVWNYHSMKCLEGKNGEVSSGILIVQEPCNQNVTQLEWNWVSGGGYWNIRDYGNVVDNVCLNARGALKTNSTPIVLGNCYKDFNSQWSTGNPVANILGYDYYELKNRNSGLCLNVSGNSTANGGQLIEYSCVLTAENEWFSWSPSGSF